MRYCSWLGMLAAIVVCGAQARAQQFWEYAGGLPEHTFSTIAIAPAGDIYASNTSTYTVWHSSTGGARWERRDIGMPGVACNVLDVTPRGTLLLGSHDHGLYRSTDNGRSWVETGFRNARVNAMTIDSAGVIYADSAGSSIWRSGDDGRSWVFYGASSGITALAISPAGILWVGRSAQDITQIAFGAHGEVYRVFGYSPYFEYSSDNGTTWKKIGPPSPYKCIVNCVASDSSGALFVGLRFDRQGSGEGGGMWTTTDNGVTWTEMNGGLQNSELFYYHKSTICAIAIGRDGIVYAGTEDAGLYASRRGSDWTKIDHTLPIDGPNPGGYPPYMQVIRTAAFSGGTAYATAIGSGVFRTNDSGTTWQQVNAGLPGRDIDEFVRGKNGAVFAVALEKQIWRLLAKDTLWQNVSPSASLDGVTLAALLDGTLYASARSHGLYTSSDNGDTWNVVSDAPKVHSFKGITANIKRNLYAFAGSIPGSVPDSVYRSEDAGKTWTYMGHPGIPIRIGGLAANSLGHVYCVSALGLAFYETSWRTTDDGAHWEPVGGSFSTRFNGSAVTIDQRDIIYLGTRGELLYSTDFGASWKSEAGGPREVTSTSVAPDGMVYVSCFQGVMRSRRFASALRATPRVLNTTLRADSVTGDYVGNPLTVWCSATNAGARALDSVRAELQVAASDASVLSAPSQLLAAHLDTSQTSAEQAWSVQILPRSTKATVRLSFLVTSKQYPDQTVTLDLVVPARPKPSFIGTLRVEPEYRIRFDSALNRYRDPVTADGKSARFTVTARLRNRGAGPSFLPTVTLSLPHGVELDSGETAKKTLAPTPMAVGDSLDCVWRCVTSGYTHDSLAWVAAQARDDSIGTVAIFGTDLFIEANRALKPAFAGTLDTDRKSGILFDSAAQFRYQAPLDAEGRRARFAVTVRMRNNGAAASPRPAITLQLPAGIDLDSNESATKFIAPAPLSAGDSAAYVWRCVTAGWTHDSLVTLRARVHDDSALVETPISGDLFIQANRRLRRGTLACTLGNDPPDTLHYDPAKKDYEGWPSAMGAYTVFRVTEQIRNSGGVTVTGVHGGGSSMSPFIVPDSGQYPWTPTMKPGEVRTMVWEVRALPDTVWRTAEFCSTFIAENADTVKCCTRLVIEPFPKPGTTGLASTSTDGFVLEQNFPNPIVLSAVGSAPGVIRYSLPSAASVQLTLHDALGRQVQELCNGMQDAGWHMVSLDPLPLAPGVYHYRLVAGSKVLQRSMTIVR